MEFFMTIGFLFAAYSVVGNDSVQTLGTFIESNRKIKWQWQWLAASAVLIATLSWSWYFNGGDISYGRLNSIPFQEIQWYHAAAPAILVILTRYGIPVSTSFLVLSTFASGLVLEKMLVKSFVGYGLAMAIALIVWAITTFFRPPIEKEDEKNHAAQWRILQWLSTGFLWHTWLAHDMANIAVFLPRQLPSWMLAGVLTILVVGLGFIFWSHGGKIQEIVKMKHRTKDVRAATMIDSTYGLILLIFKQYNDIPMSTTWVFVGLLSGRELIIAIMMGKKVKSIFPMVGKDFFKMMVGLVISIVLALLIHHVF